MIDHMVWNSKKWYEGEKKPYIGKFVYTSKDVPSYNFNQGAVEFQNIGNWRKETINGLKWFNVTTSGISLTFNGTDYIKKECFRVVSTNNHYNGAWLFDMQSDGSLKIERNGGGYNVLPANTPFISYDFRYASSNTFVSGGFYKISVCPEHPNDVGKWVIADDTSIWGGVTTS